MNERDKKLFGKINSFISKYYLNKLIRGGIYFFSLLLIFLILFSLLEYFAELDIKSRAIVFWTYITISLSVIFALIIYPLLKLLRIGQIITYKQAAKIIGEHFPQIDDKLLNILELQEMEKEERDLISASIDQKINQINNHKFNNAINLAKNKKYLKWAFIPISFICFLFIIGKEYMITESSARIINHNVFYEKKTPFDYIIKNPLFVIQYEDWDLDVTLEGREIPSELYFELNGTTFKFNKIGRNRFFYKIRGVTQDQVFILKSGKYRSSTYKLVVLIKPKVIEIELDLKYPTYTGILNEKIKNNSDIIVPEGTNVNMSIKTMSADQISIIDRLDTIIKKGSQTINYDKTILKETDLQIITSNNNNISDTTFQKIRIVKDLYPKISVKEFKDSITSVRVFKGNLEDDYGISKLIFSYERTVKDSSMIKSFEIENIGSTKESFSYNFDFGKTYAKPGEKIKYYFSVWDNDEINGNKRTNSTSFYLKKPSLQELINKEDTLNKNTQKGLNKSLQLANKIKKDIEKIKKDLLEKNNLSWKEKKRINELEKKYDELNRLIEKTIKENKLNLNNQKNINSETLKKQKQLEELMKSLIDDEERKLLQDLKKILEELDKEKLKKLLDQLGENNLNLEKELERDLELFKQIDFEQKLEQTINQIKELKNKQKDLLEKTKESEASTDSLSKTQQELINEYDAIRKSIKDLEQKNKDLEKKNMLPKTKELEEGIKQDMNESKEKLEKNQKKKSQKYQKTTIDKIEELESNLLSMQSQNNSQQQLENIEDLRQILENLIRVSFDQEDLIISVNTTPKNSSEFVNVVKNQKNISNNTKIIEDSLFALSKRVVQIQSTVNKEIGLINSNIKKSIGYLEERNSVKSAEKQQFVMTSMNNLAVLLSDILEQMQKDLDMQTSQCNKPRNCNKPKNSNSPSMSELNKAQQKLSKQLQGKKKKGKKGNKGSGARQLVELSKKQEEIRQQLMDLRNELGKNGDKGKIDKILNDMQENETDIINNNITNETLMRQAEILTRLLDAENSTRNKNEEDKRRKSNEWLNEKTRDTNYYTDYVKEKETQKDMLRTSPLKFTPYYKKQVDIYFKNLLEKND